MPGREGQRPDPHIRLGDLTGEWASPFNRRSSEGFEQGNGVIDIF